MMRTEHDLREAFQSLERHAPDAGPVLRAVYDRSPGPGRRRPAARREQPAPRRPLRLALAAGATAAAAAAAVLTATLSGGTAARSGPAAPLPFLDARLLAALSSTREDILQAGSTWVSPWYPHAGQQVRVRILGIAADGQPGKDSEYTFRFPANQAGSAASPIDWGAVTATGTLLIVDHARHTWGQWPHSSVYLALPLSAAGIRDQIAHGRLHVIGRTTLHGQPVIELGMALGRQHGPLRVTTARLWVSAKTYLPTRQLLIFSDGKRDSTDYTFLKPTAASLARLRPVIPAGYHRTGLYPDQYGKKKQK